MAIARLKPSDTKRQTELAELRTLAQKAVDNCTCHFSKLPVELVAAIFRIIIGESNTVMLRLMSVCRAWRELIVGTPSFWGRLTITGKSRQTKIDTWLERSRGRLSLLHLSRSFDFRARPKTFRAAPPTFWSDLRGLQWDNSESKGKLAEHLPDGTVPSLRLKTLCISRNRGGARLDTDLQDLDATALEELSVSTEFTMFSPDFAASCTNIVRLHLKTCSLEPSDLLPVLASTRKLESFLIHKNSVGFGTLSLDDLSLERLTYLRQLDIKGYSLRGLVSSLTRLPEIEMVAISTGEDAAAEVILESGPACLALKDLRFTGYYVTHEKLVRLLERSPSLSRLSVNGCGDSVSLRNNISVLECLADTNHILCPRLEHLEWCSSYVVKAGVMVRIVKARLPASSVTSDNADDPPDHALRVEDEHPPLPIRTLILDDCPNMDPEAIPWLKSKVPLFSCKVKKADRRKR